MVPADTVARIAKLTRPLDEETQWIVEQAILDAQSDVAAYLGQPIVPALTHETGLWPQTGGSLTAASTWLLSGEPVIAVLSAIPDVSWHGTYTVYYTYGLDAANDPALEPIRRWVRAAALASPGVAEAYETQNPVASRVITSLSAEGQSVAYGSVSVPGSSAGGAAGSGAPGSVPLLSSLDRWRVAGRRVFQRRTPGWSPVLVGAGGGPAGSQILVLDPEVPVPVGTPAGTIILRR